MKQENGFTLIELMIVVAVIAVIAAIAVPNLLRSRITANEASAVGGIRTISTAQVGFQASGFVDNDGNGEGDYGTLAQLANPDGAGAVAPFIDDVLGRGNKLGYIYNVNVTFGSAVVMPSYVCTSVPAAAGLTGYRQFFVDETGVIRYSNDGSAVDANSPSLN